MSSSTKSEWMNDLCRKLSQALGCELTYRDAPDDQNGGSIPASHIVWQAPVHNGERVAGRLQLHAPSVDMQALDPLTIQAVGTAAVFAEILEQLAIAERRLQLLDDATAVDDLDYSGNPTETPPEIARRLLHSAQRATRCWGAAFFLLDPASRTFQLRMTDTIPAECIPKPQRTLNSPDSQGIDDGDCVLNPTQCERDADWLPQSCCTAVTVPVSTSAGCLGTLWCFDRREREWTPADLGRLKNVAAHLAAGLERALLLQESDSRRRLSHELDYASKKHPSQVMGLLPNDSGLDIAIRATSAAALGGDLCEVWPLANDSTLIAIGDATGHSVPAAMIMSVARGSLRTLLGSTPAELKATAVLTSRLNGALYSVTRGEQFMTLFCGVYDHVRRTLTYTNAGHPPPWHLRDGAAAALESHGVPPGVLQEAKYEQARLTFRVGDWLICYTDGISEAMSRQRQMFRSIGIVGALALGEYDTSAQAADAIWAAVEQHTQGVPPADDQTLLVMRITR